MAIAEREIVSPSIGRPYLRGESARSVQLRTQCLREQAFDDPSYWLWLEAHYAGGKILAQGRWAVGDTTYHVAVMTTRMYVETKAIKLSPDGNEFVTNPVELAQLSDDLLFQECHDAVFFAANDDRVFYGVDGTRLHDELTEMAAVVVVEYGYTPREAADRVWAEVGVLRTNREGVTR